VTVTVFATVQHPSAEQPEAEASGCYRCPPR
jgi:hypothetical protein